MENNLPPRVMMTQMIFGFVISKAIYCVAKLNIADTLNAHGPMHCSALAAKSGAHEESLYRLMRALASIGIFQEDNSGNFSLTPMAQCLRDDSPDSVKALALGVGNVWYKAYSELTYSLQTGKGGFEYAMGMPVFDYLTANPDEGKLFDRMMTDIHGGETAPMIENYDFSAFNTIVDVGGGNGEVITSILKRHKEVKGILFDLPEVINRARQNITSTGLNDRCRLETGDFFESVTKGGDAYIMRHIIHDWSDQDAVAILSNCRKAMNQGGKVLVVEAVIQEGNEPSPFKLLDITMLMVGGKERTRKQFESIFSQAGLKLNRVVPFQNDLSVIEGVGV